MKIACVSQPLRFGDKERNIERMEDILSDPLYAGTDLFLFPENNICGFSQEATRADYWEMAEQVPEGESCARVIELAQVHDTTICAGIIEREDDELFITHFLCDAGGFIGKQRKIFAQNPEKPLCFNAGEKLGSFQVFGHSCVILACADFMFPETTILAGLAEASLILCPTDCVHENKADTMEKLLVSKSVSTNAVSVAAFGHDDNAAEGNVLAAIAVEPNGEILLSEKTRAGRDTISLVDIELRKPRQMWGGFRHRRDVLMRTL